MKKIISILAFGMIASTPAFAQTAAPQARPAQGQPQAIQKVQADFMKSCEAKGGSAQLCQCSYNTIAADMTPEEKQAVISGQPLDQRIAARLDQVLAQSVQACKQQAGVQ